MGEHNSAAPCEDGAAVDSDLRVEFPAFLSSQELVSPVSTCPSTPELSSECEAPSPFTVVASVLKDVAADAGISAEELAAVDVTCRDEAAAAARVTLAQPMEGVECFVLDNVLSAAECNYLVNRTEASGCYSFWDARPVKVTEFRDADTIELRDSGVAQLLWKRIERFMTPVVIESEEADPVRWERDLEGTWEPVGTNEHLLFARYGSGGHFAPHTDGYSIMDCDHRSMYSMVLFLNDCREGGGTRFYSDAQRDQLVKDDTGQYTGKEELVLHTVAPKAGRLVVFYHQILHEGVAVGPESSKYIIRSDVMYKRKYPICKTAADKQAFAMYQRAQELSITGDLDEAQRLFRKAFKTSQALADVYGM